MSTSSQLMAGKRGLVMGVANDRSIAWGIASTLAAHGAELAFTYQGDALAKRVKPGPGADIGRASARNAAKAVDADLEALERQLSDILGVKVQVAHKGQGGAVTLHYSSLDQLDMICQRLSGEPI